MSIFFKHAIGIDISDASIEMLELKEKGAAVRVVAYRRLELPVGIVTNGRIVDPVKLTAKLQETAKLPGFGNFTTRSAVVSLPESQTFIHLFRMPSVISEQQLGEAVQYEADATLPLFLDQTEHDYQVVNRDQDTQEVLYVACLKEVVQAYQQVVSDAGFVLEALEAESSSLARALVPKQSTDAIMLADLGSRTTILTVYDRQAVNFSENVPIAGQHLTDAIAKQLSLAPADAEALKKKSGLNSLPTAQAAEPVLMEIIAAMQKVMRTYQKNAGHPVSRVIICGGTSLLPGLVEHFSRQLGIPAVLGDPLSGVVRRDQVFSSQPVILFSTVIGLARRGLNVKALQAGVNLLRQSKSRSPRFQTKPGRQPRPSLKVSFGKGGWAAKNKRALIMLGILIILAAVFVILYYIKMMPTG
ncbi:MAG: type IV pilus assembly protein PilM [Patescibacteria group bacterium]